MQASNRPKVRSETYPTPPVTVRRSAPETARRNASVGSFSSRFSAKPASRSDPRRTGERLDLAQKTAHAALELMREFSHELRETETSEAVTEGMGLKSMRERAELLGGSFEVTSESDRGAVVRVRLPLV